MRALLTILLGTVLLAGCGGEDDPKDDPKDDAGDGGASAPVTDAPAVDCSTSLTAVYPDGTEVSLDASAEAVELGDGAAYTIYAGDYEIATEGIGTATVVPAEGSHQATIAITVFSADEAPPPITPGTSVEWTDEFGSLTFTTILYDGATPYGSALNASGTVDVLAVDDTSICIDVDYADDEKSLSGQVAAGVHDSPF